VVCVFVPARFHARMRKGFDNYCLGTVQKPPDLFSWNDSSRQMTTCRVNAFIFWQKGAGMYGNSGRMFSCPEGFWKDLPD